MKRDQLIVALDVADAKSAQKIVHRLGKEVLFYKVGMRLFTQEGPHFISWLKKKNKKVFLDLKFHDIPNTVAQAVESATKLGVDLLTVHAAGGAEMLQAAAKAARESSKKLKKKRPKIFAVTVLTSIDDLSFMGIQKKISDQVLNLAKLSSEAGIDGVVCSPEEIRMIKKKFGKKLKVLSPGIRFGQNSKDDQKRIATPQKALADGADYLVMGRPVLLAENPKGLVQQIFHQAHSR